MWIDYIISHLSLCSSPTLKKEKRKCSLSIYLNQAQRQKMMKSWKRTSRPPEPCWMDPILAYLRDEALPADKKEARQILYRAANYILVEGTLYKWGLSLLLLQCLHPEEGKKVLEELHARVCSNHIKSQVLHICALRLGYYWSTLKGEVKKLVQRYHKY